MRYVYEVSYQRADGLATSPIVCLDAEYAGAVAGWLLKPEGVTVMAVTITRRPAMEHESNG